MLSASIFIFGRKDSKYTYNIGHNLRTHEPLLRPANLQF